MICMLRKSYERLAVQLAGKPDTDRQEKISQCLISKQLDVDIYEKILPDCEEKYNTNQFL